MNPQAEELNNAIKKENRVIYDLLSEKGKAIFFPKKGILSQAADAKGKRINATIGAGIEDDKTPMRLKSIEKNISISPEDVFPYAPSFGKKELREAWKKLIKKKNPSLKADTSLPVVTNALTHGLSMTGYLFVNKGDKIILSDKFWGNYKLAFTNAYGAELDTFNTFKEEKFDISALKEKLSSNPGKQIILLNFPNNPTGYTPTEEEASQIAEAIKESAKSGNKIVAICDDAYFGLVYKKGIFKQSIFAKLADIHENVLAVKIDGATKEDYVWGLRVGFITYNNLKASEKTYSALEAKTAGAIRGNISNVSHLSQSLVLKAFESETYEKEKKEKYELMKSRFDEVMRVLENPKFTEFFRPIPYNSGYFMCIKLNKNIDAEKVRQILLEKYSTGVISIENLLRIAFSSVAKSDIKKLFENIYSACKEL